MRDEKQKHRLCNSEPGAVATESRLYREVVQRSETRSLLFPVLSCFESSLIFAVGLFLRSLSRAPVLAVIMLLAASICSAQVVDKMVATVNAGVRTDLITYSDLLWQLALQPSTRLENPTSEDLNRALLLVIDQRLILQEAEKLPTI